MLWKIIIARDSAEIFTAFILLVAVFFSYRLVKEDEGPIWDIILIAVSFLAFSTIFGIIKKFFIIEIFNVLEHIFMMVSGVALASVLAFASIKEKYLEAKNE